MATDEGLRYEVVVPHAAIRGEVVETPVAVPEAVIVAGA